MTMRAVPIIRSRTGCFTCRRRKKKCNEEKPVCSGCKRNKLECHWPADVSVQDQSHGRDNAPATSTSTSKPAASASSGGSPPQRDSQSPRSPIQPPQMPQLVVPSREKPASHFLSQPPLPHSPAARRRYSDGSSDASSRGSGSGGGVEDIQDDTLDNPLSPSTPMSPFAALINASSNSVNFPSGHPPNAPPPDISTIAFVSGRESFSSGDNIYMHDNIPINMSLLPSHGHDSYELLSYYLARTANSMGNGSTDINPFVAKLIPLAFSDPLVLHLILAQSAVHRQASKECPSGGEVATRYYTDSLHMFRNLVGEYVAGKESNNLVVTVGSLILCLTEVARGDVHGTIFDHLAASKSLLTSLLNRPAPEISDDLPDFLVEYYMHMVASSMISKDHRASSQSALTPTIEAAAKKLLEKNYMGQLCGCWLEILTLIPQVFQLGQSMLRATNQPTMPTSPDDIITFGLLQSQILGFLPSIMAGANSQLAGLVFKQATLLYLWSLFGTPQQNAQSSMHADLMNSAVMEAISVLNQLPASERVNTSLCWPLTVIGCCTTNLEVQQVLRLRLQAMIDHIGLGNMRQTLTLLEHVWKQHPAEISPWTLRKVMQHHEIWISFA